MKYIVLLLFIMPVVAFAQENGDTKVIVQNELSADDNFIKVGEVLSEVGYGVRKRDPIFKSVESGVIEMKGIKRGTYKQIMLFAIKDNQVTITSWFKRRGKGKDIATFDAGDTVTLAFENMAKVANAIGGVVSYD